MPHGPGNRSATLRVYLHGSTAGSVGQLSEAPIAELRSVQAALVTSHEASLLSVLANA